MAASAVVPPVKGASSSKAYPARAPMRSSLDEAVAAPLETVSIDVRLPQGLAAGCAGAGVGSIPSGWDKMDFSLTEDQRAIQDAARQFAEAEFMPHSAEWDDKKHFPVDAMRQAAALGFAGIYVKDDVGGSGLTRLDAAIIFEELARGDVAVAAFISIHNMASWMIDRFGSDALRQKYLPRLTTMEWIASYCLTEPG